MSEGRGVDLIHEPRCNTNCTPAAHYLTNGIGFPHIHRTDLSSACGECVTRPTPATSPRLDDHATMGTDT